MDDQTENTTDTMIDAFADAATEPSADAGDDLPIDGNSTMTADDSAETGENTAPADPADDTNSSEAVELTPPELDAPAEDSGDQTTKKAEAAETDSKSSTSDEWQVHLKKFHDDVNGVFAAKENFKLVCVDKNAKPAFSRNWKMESNKYFQLVVNLRRRRLGTKVGGKTVA